MDLGLGGLGGRCGLTQEGTEMTKGEATDHVILMLQEGKLEFLAGPAAETARGPLRPPNWPAP